MKIERIGKAITAVGVLGTIVSIVIMAVLRGNNPFVYLCPGLGLFAVAAGLFVRAIGEYFNRG